MYKEILFIIINLVGLLLVSCSGSEKTDNKNNTPADTTQYIKQVPPGSADVKAEIVSRSVRNDDLVYKIKIIEVTGYGPAFSPLPPGKEIEVYLSKSLDKIEREKIKTVMVFSGRILQTRSPNGDYWEIIIVK